MKKYIIGIDYGTDSVRSAVIDAESGEELVTCEKRYKNWAKGNFCNPQKNQYRQHPKDYIDGLIDSVRGALSKCDSNVTENIVGLGFDTTGSTPVLIDASGTPLALLPEFEDNPNAMFILWKDHTAIREADEINALAKQWETDYTKYEGGIYSSEWAWAKVLKVLRADAAVRERAFSWVEHCDWMPALVTGATDPTKMKRSRCAAGHKAMWHKDWDGLPSESFLTTLDPLLKGFRENLYSDTYTSDEYVGNISEEWASLLGLSTDVRVGVGILDAHAGAIGGGVKEGSLLRIIGTSTCDIMVVPHEEIKDRLISGICGQVDGSVIPGFVGIEAGQSAFGDIFAWFKDFLSWPLDFLENENRKKIESRMLDNLSEAAALLPVTENDIIATDWLNGRRSPDVDLSLKGSITGLTLGTTAPMVF